MADTFICTICGELCSDDEWNDSDICDGCKEVKNDNSM